MSSPDNAAPDPVASSSFQRNRWAAAGFLLVFALALFVRVYGFREEPVSLEAFSSVIHLDPPDSYKNSPYYDRWRAMVTHEDVPDLKTFLARNRMFDPATMPLYYTFEYLWNRYIDRSMTSVRLISLFFGMLMIPLIYLLGRDLYGRNAGLIAAMCVALSPVHRFYAREIRMYVLMSLLALFSAYTFMHLVRDGRKRWWLLHGIANFLLMWTQPLAMLLPFVEGLFLILFSWRNYKRILAWGAMHVALAMPPLLYIVSIQYWSQNLTAYLKVPEWPVFLGDLIADDAVGLTYQSRPLLQGWELIVSPETAHRIVAWYPLVARWLFWFTIASALWLGCRTLWKATRKTEAATAAAPWPWYFFLLMWWLVPPIVLYAISVEWRPCVEPRYTLHCSFAMYLLVAGALTQIPWRALRVPAIAALLALYGYEQMLVFKGIQFPDWKTATAYLESEAKRDDLILHLDQYYTRAFVFNLGPIENVYSYAKTTDTLADQAAFFVGLKRPSRYSPSEPRIAWAIIRTYGYAAGTQFEFENQLKARGLAFERKALDDMDGLRIYRVSLEPGLARPIDRKDPWQPYSSDEFSDLALEFWKAQDYETALAFARKAAEILPTSTKAYCYIGMTLEQRGEKDAALEAFRKAVECNSWESLMPTSYSHIGQLLMERKDYDGAIAAFRRAMGYNENYHYPHVCLGKAYLAKGDYVHARERFERALQLFPGDQEAQAGLKEADALKASGSPLPPVDAAADSADLMNEGLKYLAEGKYDAAIGTFKNALPLLPNDPGVHAAMAIALLGKGDEQGALAALRKYFELDPEAARKTGPLVDAIFVTKDYDKAWALVKQLKAEGETMPKELISKLQRDSGRNE